MAKVLRIQHIEDGSGPFTSTHPKVRDVVDSTKLPQPSDDIGFDEAALDRLQDEKLSPTKFGFKDKAQMSKTFTSKHLATLKEYGYKPKWVDAKDTWSSNHQVFYTTHEGDKNHAKEAEATKKRTKFKEYTPEEIAGMNKSLSRIKELLAKTKDLRKADDDDDKGHIARNTDAPQIKENGDERDRTVHDKRKDEKKAAAKKKEAELNVGDVRRAQAQAKRNGPKQPKVTAASIKIERQLRDMKIKAAQAQAQSDKDKAANHQKVLDMLKDPKKRAAALAENSKKAADKKAIKDKEKAKDKGYDEGIKTGQAGEPVATKKRNSNYINQNKRRADANDNKLINKENNKEVKNINKEDEKLESSLKEAVEELNKAMKNGGIGGQGAVLAGNTKALLDPNNIMQPSTAPSLKKNPAKVAAQPNTSIKFKKNGQWSLDKANVNEPNTSSIWTDPSISHTGGKTRKWQGSDPRQSKNEFTEHSKDLGPTIPEKKDGKGKYRARTTGVSDKRSQEKLDENGYEQGDVGKPQGEAKKYFKKSELIKFDNNQQWSLEKVARGRAQEEHVDAQNYAEHVHNDDHYTEKDRRKARRWQNDTFITAREEEKKAIRTQAEANKKINAKRDAKAKIMRPSENLEEGISRLKDKFNKADDLVDMRIDTPTKTKAKAYLEDARNYAEAKDLPKAKRAIREHKDAAGKTRMAIQSEKAKQKQNKG